MNIKYLLPLILLLVQGTYCFCIYNFLTDGSSIEVYQSHARVDSGKGFAKTIESGGKECCAYTNRDCSYRGTNTDPADFDVYFNFPRHKSLRHLIQCTTGSGVNVFGSEGDFYAICVLANGDQKRVPILPYAVTS
ncbi:uncharacterized protein EV154DRAFT_476216 [Mucor mucedo]|uniref:uncharacterized protein n=1 Tax=Mucor mucedo TaxID=29922 RepID=UPI00221F8D4C|nr:uncharacterized protein EV154DRAFT_476216 [Mucor mucedo]KAI7896568.1 hypothetical protein EV154DRAFT_476216 [Mucor mucedo]